MSRRSPAKKRAAEDEDDVVIVETPCAVCKKAEADTFALSACKHGLHASCYIKVRGSLCVCVRARAHALGAATERRLPGLQGGLDVARGGQFNDARRLSRRRRQATRRNAHCQCSGCVDGRRSQEPVKGYGQVARCSQARGGDARPRPQGRWLAPRQRRQLVAVGLGHRVWWLGRDARV